MREGCCPAGEEIPCGELSVIAHPVTGSVSTGPITGWMNGWMNGLVNIDVEHALRAVVQRPIATTCKCVIHQTRGAPVSTATADG